MAWIAVGTTVIGSGIKVAKSIQQRKEAEKLKQAQVSSKTTERENRSRLKANQTTDTIAEDQREQLDQGAANAANRVRETGGSSVDQLQAIQATERQRQTGEQNIGIQQAGRKRQDENDLNAALSATASEERQNRVAYEGQKASLLNAADQNMFSGVEGVAAAGIAGTNAALGNQGGISGAMGLGDNNASPTLGSKATPNATGAKINPLTGRPYTQLELAAQKG